MRASAGTGTRPYGVMVTKDDILSGLKEIGLNKADVVVAHGSLSSFGEVDGGAAAVVDAILQALGPTGTLIVPTFNYKPDVYDPATTPSLVGKITEEVRARPNAARSLHPTHSVAAIGPLAREITKGHERTTAFGRGSALFKVLQVGGKILQLGVTHTSNSMMHVAEEIVDVPYLEKQRYVGFKTAGGKVMHKWIRRPGCSKGFDAIEDALQESGAIAETMIGGCRARLMTARAVVDAAVEALNFDTEALLCDLPDCDVCAESRAMVAATEADKRDQEVIEIAEEPERARREMEERLGGGEVRHFDLEGLGSSQN